MAAKKDESPLMKAEWLMYIAEEPIYKETKGGLMATVKLASIQKSSSGKRLRPLVFAFDENVEKLKEMTKESGGSLIMKKVRVVLTYKLFDVTDSDSVSLSYHVKEISLVKEEAETDNKPEKPESGKKDDFLAFSNFLQAGNWMN